MQRVLIGRIVATCGAVVLVVGTFVPWLRSGTRRRDSYEIFALVERLGYSKSDAVGWGLRLWPVLPLLVAVAVTLLWFPRRGFVAAAVGLTVAYTALVAIAVRVADPESIIAVEQGPTVALTGAILLAIGSLLTFPQSSSDGQG